MKAYIHRLVSRLSHAEQPLSRNRHFDTFDNPHGRRALRLSRQLRSLARDIVEQSEVGCPVRIEREEQSGELIRVLVHFERLKARRTAFLSAAEYELLLESDAVRRAIGL